MLTASSDESKLRTMGRLGSAHHTCSQLARTRCDLAQAGSVALLVRGREEWDVLISDRRNGVCTRRCAVVASRSRIAVMAKCLRLQAVPMGVVCAGV